MIFLAEYLPNLPPNVFFSHNSITGYYLMLYLPIFPNLLFVMLNFLRSLNAYILKRNLSKQDHYFLVNDPNPLANASQLEHVFLDKTGTMTS